MAIEYEILAVKLTPQQAAAAQTEVLHRIVPKERVGWSRELNSEGFLSVSTDPWTLPDIVKESLRNPFKNPLEIRLIRDSVLEFAGPLLGYQIQAGTLTLNARGLPYYLRWMYVWPNDKSYNAQDLFVIAKDLVDQWQNQDYGDFGIDTSGIGTSGVTATKNYKASELHNVFDEIKDLGERDSGFDFEIDPSTRDLILHAPQKGSDISGSIIIDSRNIISRNLFIGTARGHIAGLALGVGVSEDKPPIFSTQENATALAQIGRRAVAETFQGVTVQSTLDAHTSELLDAHDQMHFAPVTAGGSVFPVPGASLEDFDVGDVITFDVDMGLGLQQVARRITAINISRGPEGDETLTIEIE